MTSLQKYYYKVIRYDIASKVKKEVRTSQQHLLKVVPMLTVKYKNSPNCTISTGAPYIFQTNDIPRRYIHAGVHFTFNNISRWLDFRKIKIHHLVDTNTWCMA